MSFILSEIYFTNLHLNDGPEVLFQYLVQELLFFGFGWYRDRLLLCNIVLCSDIFFGIIYLHFFSCCQNLRLCIRPIAREVRVGAMTNKLISLIKKCNTLSHQRVASVEPSWLVTTHFQKNVHPSCFVEYYGVHHEIKVWILQS
jgi:hypothetical protein